MIDPKVTAIINEYDAKFSRLLDADNVCGAIMQMNILTGVYRTLEAFGTIEDMSKVNEKIIELQRRVDDKLSEELNSYR